MKHLQVYISLLLVTVFSVSTYGWGGDVMVGPVPSGFSSMTARASGELFISLPENPTGMSIMNSNDNGMTWSVYMSTAAGLAVNKSKLVTTAVDSVYCYYTAGDSLYILSVISGQQVTFPVAIVDFDIAPTSTGNAVHIFYQPTGSPAVRRTSTADGGQTILVAPILVASDAAHPRVDLSGTVLILSYYNPILTDTSTSAIRIADYHESGVGLLSPGTFQEIAPSTSVHRNQFMPVITGSNVWFIFSEEDHFMKAKSSTNSGTTYGAEFTIDGLGGNAFCFDARHDESIPGVHLAYFFDSAATTSIRYRMAASASPLAFSSPLTISDGVPECSLEYHRPSITTVPGSLPGVGAAWVQATALPAELYFDASSFTTSIPEDLHSIQSLEIFPTPVNEMPEVRLSAARSSEVEAEVYSVTGAFVLGKKVRLEAGENRFTLDLSGLSKGTYTLIVGDRKVSFVR